eukprot:1081457-Prorocentrum_lima.AAC.1
MVYVWLTGRSRGEELDLRKFSRRGRAIFDASMAKEWDKWTWLKAIRHIGREGRRVEEEGSEAQRHSFEVGPHKQERARPKATTTSSVP